VIVLGAAVVWLAVSDLERACAFYRDSLGLRVEQQAEQWAQLEIDGLRVGLNASEHPRGEGGAVIAFRPREGLEEAVEQLRAEGVEIAGEPTEHPWGRIATFKDPDGNDLQLYEPPGA
jgi:predicted enzyme related to lactoylglutathione lyase